MSENPYESALRSLPAVGKLSEHGDLSEHLAQYGQPALVAAARKTIDQARQQILSNQSAPTLEELVQEVQQRLSTPPRPSKKSSMQQVFFCTQI